MLCQIHGAYGRCQFELSGEIVSSACLSAGFTSLIPTCFLHVSSLFGESIATVATAVLSHLSSRHARFGHG